MSIHFHDRLSRVGPVAARFLRLSAAKAPGGTHSVATPHSASRKEMIIVVLSLTQCYAGGEKSVEVLISEWAKTCVVVVLAEHPAHLDALRKIEGANIHILPAAPGKSIVSLLKNFLHLAGIIRRFGADVILANSNKAAMVVALWRRFPGRPAIPTGIYLRSFGWRYLDFILRSLPDSVVLAPTAYVFEDAAYASTRLSRTRSAIVPNGAKIPSREPTNSEQENILCLATITRWKGLHYLLEAFSLVVSEEPAARLRILGRVFDAAYFQELQHQRKRLGLEGSVEFVPFVQDPAEEYRKARFLVVSSIAEFDGPETFSRVIIEAWAAHRTVVSFAVGGPKYIINPEINGLLVPEKNIAAFAQAMLLLTRDGALRERLALAGFEEVKRRYGADVVADQTLKVIHGRAPV